MKKSLYAALAIVLFPVIAMGQECPTPATATATVTFKRAKSDVLKGHFRIDASHSVQFSKGNLMYTISTNTWRFMDEQYSIAERNINEYPGINYASLDVVSLFGWGANNNSASGTHYQPWDLSTENTYGDLGQPYDYSDWDASKSDWGINMDGDWRTLSINEWQYILSSRATDLTINGTNNARWVDAKILTDGSGVAGIDYNICGLIIFPDDYTGSTTPAGVTWSTVNGGTDFGTTCTTAGWAMLEAAGCVFLPCAGLRSGIYVQEVDAEGYYWSSTSGAAGKARALFFESGYMNLSDGRDRHMGYSVRLVLPVE